jgi:Skp family chaperone for outer membrane proteins
MYKKIIVVFLLISTACFAQKLRIGVFDSRAVAIAYYQSGYHEQDLKKLLNEYNKASDAGDTLLAKKISNRVEVLQMIAHDKGFGKGTVNNILDRFKKELDDLAKRENVSMIVSKWELYSVSDNMEMIDITDEVAHIINGDEKIRNYIRELIKTPTIDDAFFIED